MFFLFWKMRERCGDNGVSFLLRKSTFNTETWDVQTLCRLQMRAVNLTCTGAVTRGAVATAASLWSRRRPARTARPVGNRPSKTSILRVTENSVFVPASGNVKSFIVEIFLIFRNCEC